jgi:hypothetical protein
MHSSLHTFTRTGTGTQIHVLSCHLHSNARVHALVNFVQVYRFLWRRAVHRECDVSAGGLLCEENHAAEFACGVCSGPAAMCT